MLKNLVKSNAKEEELQNYLKENNNILITAFGTPAWHYNIVVPKFKFGNEFVSDFVIIHGQSYSYWIELIELEPANVAVFTKSGVYAKRLNSAIKQVEEWEDWINNNKDYFKQTLLKAIKKVDPTFNESFDGARRFITKKHIVIGTRAQLTDDNNIRRSTAYEKGRTDIATYDRLIDIEENLIQMKASNKNFR